MKRDYTQSIGEGGHVIFGFETTRGKKEGKLVGGGKGVRRCAHTGRGVVRNSAFEGKKSSKSVRGERGGGKEKKGKGELENIMGLPYSL